MQHGPKLFLTHDQAKQAYKAALERKSKIQFDEQGPVYELLTGVLEDGSEQIYVFDPQNKLGEGAQGEVFLSQMLFKTKAENENIENLVVLKRSPPLFTMNVETVSDAKSDGPPPQLFLSADQAKQACQAAAIGKSTIQFEEEGPEYQLFTSSLNDKDGSKQVYVFDPKNKLSEVPAQNVVSFLGQMVFETKEGNKSAENLVVLKRLPGTVSIDTQTAFEVESQILTHLDRQKGYFFPNDQQLYLVSKLCSGVKLTDLMYDKDGNKLKLEPELINKITRAILTALEALRKKGVLHRDVKPDNIIIHIDGDEVTAELIDFGTSCLMQNSDKIFVGTHGYVAVEMYLPPNQSPVYNLQTEYFSIGIVLAEMLSSGNYIKYRQAKVDDGKAQEKELPYTYDDVKKAFSDLFSEKERLLSIDKEKLQPEEKNKLQFINFIFSLLEENFCARPGFSKIQDMIGTLGKSPVNTLKSTPKGTRKHKFVKLPERYQRLATKQREGLTYWGEYDPDSEKPNDRAEPTPAPLGSPDLRELVAEAQKVEFPDEQAAEEETDEKKESDPAVPARSAITPRYRNTVLAGVVERRQSMGAAGSLPPKPQTPSQ